MIEDLPVAGQHWPKSGIPPATCRSYPTSGDVVVLSGT